MIISLSLFFQLQKIQSQKILLKLKPKKYIKTKTSFLILFGKNLKTVCNLGADC